MLIDRPFCHASYYINLASLPPAANLIPFLSFLRWGFAALLTNEFTGATFDCDAGMLPEACERTGEQVLNRMKFNDYTTAESCFGLGMVLLGFTFSAYVFLVLGRLSYVSLGHVGRKQKSFVDVDEAAAIAAQASMGISRTESFEKLGRKADQSAPAGTMAAVPPHLTV